MSIDVERATTRHLLAWLEAEGFDVPAYLSGLRPALGGLRAAYRPGAEGPAFGDADTRAAYVFGYHPAHVAAALEIYHRLGPRLLGFEGREDLRVVHLGAGPGAELLALARFAHQIPELARLDVTLVDRQEGWARTRKHTLDELHQLAPTVSIALEERWEDLNEAASLERLAARLGSAHLVTMQTLLTELPGPRGQRLTADIEPLMGPDARLLVTDLHRVPAGAAALQTLTQVSGLSTIGHTAGNLTLSSPTEPLRSHFWSGDSGLRARGTVATTSKLLARPGRARLVSKSDRPTSSQQRVIDAFPEFLANGPRAAILTGGAGTGKTTLAWHLARMALEAGLTPRLLAPTGQAARRISEQVGLPGDTIHSVVYAYEGSDTGDDDGVVVTVFQPTSPDPSPALWLVDEASMIGDTPYGEQDVGSDAEDMPSSILRFGEGCLLTDLLRHTSGPSSSRIVLIGDPFQLPPIGEPRQRRPALEPDTVAEHMGQQPVEWHLTEATRQAQGSPILRIAERIREEGRLVVDPGQDAVQTLDLDGTLPEHVAREVLAGTAAIVTYTNRATARRNQELRTSAGRPPEIPVPADRLLVCRNHSTLGLLNGTEVEVIEQTGEPEQAYGRLGRDPRPYTADLIPLRVRLPHPHLGDRELEVKVVSELLPAMRRDVAEGVDRALRADLIRRAKIGPKDPSWNRVAVTDDRYMALRASYAYARTCHRAQGSEWERVAVLANDVIDRSWRYTAVTRARSGLWITGVDADDYVAADLLPGIQDELASHGVDVARISLMSGEELRVIVNCDGTEVPLTIHCEGGRRPSRVRAQGSSPELAASAVVVLRRWARQLRAARAPLEAALEVGVATLLVDLTRNGMDGLAYKHGDWKIAIDVIDAQGGEARMLLDHSADLRVSTRNAQVVSRWGDATTQARVRQVLARS